MHKNLVRTNKVLLLLNEHGDPLFLFQNSSSYNINNQWAKFDKSLSVSYISVESPKLLYSKSKARVSFGVACSHV